MTAFENIRFCVQCGSALQPRVMFGQMRPVCPTCGWIYFEDPKVAVAVLVERQDQVLLVQRANEPGRGLWSLPAGFMDAHEDPASAAARECREETGLAVVITGLRGVVAGREHARGADFLLIYTAVIQSGDLCAGDDADAAQFFPRAQLPPLAFRATRVALGLEDAPLFAKHIAP